MAGQLSSAKQVHPPQRIDAEALATLFRPELQPVFDRRLERLQPRPGFRGTELLVAAEEDADMALRRRDIHGKDQCEVGQPALPEPGAAPRHQSPFFRMPSREQRPEAALAEFRGAADAEVEFAHGSTR
jgi:hypothetical protein